MIGITNADGGGGVTSEDVTVTRADIPAGLTAVTSDSDDEVVTGTMTLTGNSGTGDVIKGKTFYNTNYKTKLTGTLELTGNAGTGHVLSGKTFYTTNPKSKQTGTMPNQGTKNASLNCGASYTIPAGYHNGSGKVTANSLSSQTSGTATAAYIRKGYTAWVNGTKITGNMTVSSLVSFSVAAYSTSQVQCTWKWPSKGPYSGVAICGKAGSYPSNINDSRLYTGYGNTYALNSTSTTTIGGLSAGTTYYFRVWVYCTCSGGDIYSNYSQATCKVTSHGQTTLTSSGTWTVPAGVRSIDICCVGGGGGGSGAYVWRTGSDHSYTSDCTSGGGGAGGYVVTKTGVAVTPGQQHAVVIGSGGTGGGYTYSTDDSLPTPGWPATNGGSTSLGSLCSANGGTRSSGRPGGDNGTGYGKGGSGATGYRYDAGSGGAGLSTFAGTHGGGGGGGNYGFDNDGTPWYGANGAGGSGGGGTGGWCNGRGSSTNPTSGSANTGGGGGGAWVRKYDSYGSGSNGANGGTGVIIIKW